MPNDEPPRTIPLASHNGMAVSQPHADLKLTCYLFVQQQVRGSVGDCLGDWAPSPYVTPHMIPRNGFMERCHAWCLLRSSAIHILATVRATIPFGRHCCARGFPRNMVHDPLPEMHLEPSYQCNSDPKGVYSLPLAEISFPSTASTSSTGLRKGFLSSSAAKPTKQVRHRKFANEMAGSTCCAHHASDRIPDDTEASSGAARLW